MRRRRFIRAAALLVFAIVVPRAGSAQQVHLNAHSHNDYEHQRPLFDALDRGFGSIEADIYLVKGKLLVGHTRDSLNESRTLESLYFAPLRARVMDVRDTSMTVRTRSRLSST